MPDLFGKALRELLKQIQEATPSQLEGLLKNVNLAKAVGRTSYLAFLGDLATSAQSRLILSLADRLSDADESNRYDKEGCILDAHKSCAGKGHLKWGKQHDPPAQLVNIADQLQGQLEKVRFTNIRFNIAARSVAREWIAAQRKLFNDVEELIIKGTRCRQPKGESKTCRVTYYGPGKKCVRKEIPKS